MTNETKKIQSWKTPGKFYALAELRAAFEAVEDETNWKMPINSIIPASEQEVTEEAIVFYAGCKAKFTALPGTGKRRMVRVEAVGYYQAVGA